jgi:hypothetical protein
MKTTVDIPDELLIAAKKKAAEQRRPLRALIEDGLRVILDPKRQPRKKSVTLITCKGGLAPGLDLSNREAMQDWIEKQS